MGCHFLSQGIFPTQDTKHLSISLIVCQWKDCCFCSVSQSCSTLSYPMDHSTTGFPVFHHLLELAQAHVHWVSDAIQPFVLCRPLLLLSSIFLSIRVFSNELCVHIRWPKYWSFNFSSVLLMNIQDWFPLGLTSLISLQPKESQASSSIPQVKKKKINSSAFSLLYGPNFTSIHDYRKNYSFDYTELSGKVMSLIFNMLTMLVINFLPRIKCLLILWLWSPTAVIVEPEKIKSVTVSIAFPCSCLEWWDWMPWS